MEAKGRKVEGPEPAYHIRARPPAGLIISLFSILITFSWFAIPRALYLVGILDIYGSWMGVEGEGDDNFLSCEVEGLVLSGPGS